MLIRSAIKSIQHVSAAYVAGVTDVTISAVNTSKAVILNGGAGQSAGSPYTLTLTFLNSTTVRVVGGPLGCTYTFSVVEFN